MILMVAKGYNDDNVMVMPVSIMRAVLRNVLPIMITSKWNC